MNRPSVVVHSGLTTQLSEKGKAIGAPPGSLVGWSLCGSPNGPRPQAPRSQVSHRDLLCIKVTCGT